MSETKPFIIEVDVAMVHENPENPRKISAAAFKKLVKSLEAFPEMLWKRPPVVITRPDGEYEALGGNKRSNAARKAGLKRIPIIIADDWTEEQRKRFIVLDNDNAGDWDFKMLAGQYSMTYLLEHTSISLPSSMLRTGSELQDGFEPTDLRAVVTDIVPGTLVIIGEHRLVCGDSGNTAMVDLLMNQRTVDLIVTDPPYGVNYVGKTKARHAVTNDGKETLPAILDGAFRQYFRVARPGCPLYVSHPAGSNQEMFWAALQATGHVIRQQLIWVKDAAVMGHSDYHYRHEPILLAYKPGEKGRMGRGGEHWQGGNSQNTVFEFPRPKRNADHGTEKPVDLWATFIRNHSTPEDLVADFFVGSGTTMVACHELGRVAYCMDIDPRCCQVVVDRMKALAPDLKVEVIKPVNEPAVV